MLYSELFKEVVRKHLRQKLSYSLKINLIKGYQNLPSSDDFNRMYNKNKRCIVRGFTQQKILYPKLYIFSLFNLIWLIWIRNRIKERKKGYVTIKISTFQNPKHILLLNIIIEKRKH